MHEIVVEDSEDPDKPTESLARKIHKESMEIPHDSTQYRSQIDKTVAAQYISKSLAYLLAKIHPGLDNTLPSLLVGNIVSSVVNHYTTPLQLGIGLLMGESKSLLAHLYDYRVTCTHDEVLRFKKSAAIAKDTDIQDQGISHASVGLVQVVADNFDATLSTPNCVGSTHCLAMIAIQPTSEMTQQDKTQFERVKKGEMPSLRVADHDEYAKFNLLEKKPKMPKVPCQNLSEEVLEKQKSSKERSQEINFAFMKAIATSTGIPEYHGFCTQRAREEDLSLRPKTTVAYLPLVDKPPTDPYTIAHSMLKAQKVSKSVNQEFVIYNADQQLYRIAVQNCWQNESLFANIIPRLGGMHLLMSYVGCIGQLMENTGLTEMMSAAFGSIDAMLSGKKYPQNVRALRMVVEELLRPLFQANQLKSAEDLWNLLEELGKRSVTSRLWVECLIKPVFKMSTYISAERESDWSLHLLIVEGMIPLFFAAGHYNYARYTLYYLRSMQALPDNVLYHFLAGEHTMRHAAGIRNGIWADMAIETTYMRYGHTMGGIIGITQSPETLKIWAYSKHACNQIISSMCAMHEETQAPITHHKEEGRARMSSDEKDRKKL